MEEDNNKTSEETENSNTPKIIMVVTALILGLMFFTHKDSKTLETEKAITGISKSQNYRDLSYHLSSPDLDNVKIVDAVKSKVNYKEWLIQYVLDECALPENSACDNALFIQKLQNVFALNLPKNDIEIAKNYISNEKLSHDIFRLVSYEKISDRYKTIVGSSYLEKSIEQGESLLLDVKKKTAKVGLAVSEFHDIRDLLESQKCSTITSTSFLKPLCNEPVSTWNKGIIINFTSEMYRSAKNEDSNDKLKELKNLHETIDEFKGTTYGKVIKIELTALQSKIESRIPSEYEINKNNARQLIESQIIVNKLQDLQQQQKELQKQAEQ